MFLNRHLSGNGQKWLDLNFYSFFSISHSNKTFCLNFLGGSVPLCIMANVQPVLLFDCFYKPAVLSIVSRPTIIKASWLFLSTALVFCAFIFCLKRGLYDSFYFLILMFVLLKLMWFVVFLLRFIVLVRKTSLTWLTFAFQLMLILAVIDDNWLLIILSSFSSRLVLTILFLIESLRLL